MFLGCRLWIGVGVWGFGDFGMLGFWDFGILGFRVGGLGFRV